MSVQSHTHGSSSKFSLGRGIHKLRVLSVRAGNAALHSLALSVASSRVASSVLTSAIVADSRIAASTALASAAQVQSCAAVALRLPLRGEAREKIAELIRVYIANHPDFVEQLASLPRTEQVLIAGLEGTVISALATLTVQQALLSCLWIRNGGSVAELQQQAVENSILAVGGVGGSVAGAAFGTLFFPGLGTSVGSLLGGFFGSQAIACVLPGATASEIAWNPTRMLSIVEVDSDDEWLEIKDASTKCRFEAQFDDVREAVPVPTTTTSSAVDHQHHTTVIHGGDEATNVTDALPLDLGDDDIFVYFKVDDDPLTPTE